MTDTPAANSATYRFPRLPKRGLLMGLSALRVAALAVALLILVPAIFVAGPTGGLLTAPLWGALAVGAFVRRGEQPVVDWVPTIGHYGWRRATGQTHYRIRPDQPRPGGTLALPGDAASLRFLTDEAGAAMIHDPHARTLTAVAMVTHPAFVLQSPDEQARRVQGWSRTLAHLAATGTGTRVQVLEISLPDAGHGITGWWDTHQDPAMAGTWVAAQYEHLMTTVVPAAATHRTLLAVSLDLHAARTQIRRSGRGLAGAASFLRQELTSVEAGMRAAELRVHPWLGEADLAALLRTAYEPGYEQQEHPPARLSDAGPVAVDEHWDHLRHDTGHSAVLWINEWPRVPAPPFFLHALIFRPGIRKTLSLTFEPVPADQALRDIRRARVEYATDSAQKARLGVLPDLSDSVEAGDVIDRERALIEGHADIRFTGLLTITAPSRDELEAALADVARAAVQCGCETRRLNGRQARAFTAAALPLARQVSR